jgi:GNAT superfamily N-acetyltransferase
MRVKYQWRGKFTSGELNRLHAEAFGTRVFEDWEWDWEKQVGDHSLGWVVARGEDKLVGFVNVVWDGQVHAWIQDTMVAAEAGRQGIGTRLVAMARQAAAAAGCEWLHVDFDDDLRPFYIDSCGFTPTNGGLIGLR